MDNDVALIMKLQANRHIILYRPEIARIVGGAAAAIFLQQVQYWWVQQGFKAFYKFNAPCRHKFYRSGDSWREELGFSASNLRTARRLVAIKKKAGTTMQEARLRTMTGKIKPVIYWTNPGRVTYYTIHPPAYLQVLREAYMDGESERDRIQRSLLGREEELLNAESAFSKMQKVHLAKSTKCILQNPQSAFRIPQTTTDYPKDQQQQGDAVVVDGWEIATLFNEEQSDAFQSLMDNGITPQVSAELVVKHSDGLGRIQSWIDYAIRLDKEKFEFSNYPGFIVAGLRSNQAALPPP